MNRPDYKISPIGQVSVGEGGFVLEIDPEFRPGLGALEGFSHLVVVWWCHLLDDPASRSILEIDRPYKQAPARMGIFATRSPVRPNPIALTVVPVLGLDPETGLIHVPYIDAEDGTPIIDLKPYHPSVDRVREVALPAWCSHWPMWYEDSADFDWDAEFIYGE